MAALESDDAVAAFSSLRPVCAGLERLASLLTSAASVRGFHIGSHDALLATLQELVCSLRHDQSEESSVRLGRPSSGSSRLEALLHGLGARAWRGLAVELRPPRLFVGGGLDHAITDIQLLLPGDECPAGYEVVGTSLTGLYAGDLGSGLGALRGAAAAWPVKTWVSVSGRPSSRGSRGSSRDARAQTEGTAAQALSRPASARARAATAGISGLLGGEDRRDGSGAGGEEAGQGGDREPFPASSPDSSRLGTTVTPRHSPASHSHSSPTSTPPSPSSTSDAALETLISGVEATPGGILPWTNGAPGVRLAVLRAHPTTTTTKTTTTTTPTTPSSSSSSTSSHTPHARNPAHGPTPHLPPITQLCLVDLDAGEFLPPSFFAVRRAGTPHVAPITIPEQDVGSSDVEAEWTRGAEEVQDEEEGSQSEEEEEEEEEVVVGGEEDGDGGGGEGASRGGEGEKGAGGKGRKSVVEEGEEGAGSGSVERSNSAKLGRAGSGRRRHTTMGHGVRLGGASRAQSVPVARRSLRKPARRKMQRSLYLCASRTPGAPILDVAFCFPDGGTIRDIRHGLAARAAAMTHPVSRAAVEARTQLTLSTTALHSRASHPPSSTSTSTTTPSPTTSSTVLGPLRFAGLRERIPEGFSVLSSTVFGRPGHVAGGEMIGPPTSPRSTTSIARRRRIFVSYRKDTAHLTLMTGAASALQDALKAVSRWRRPHSSSTSDPTHSSPPSSPAPQTTPTDKPIDTLPSPTPLRPPRTKLKPPPITRIHLVWPRNGEEGGESEGKREEGDGGGGEEEESGERKVDGERESKGKEEEIWPTRAFGIPELRKGLSDDVDVDSLDAEGKSGMVVGFTPVRGGDGRDVKKRRKRARTDTNSLPDDLAVLQEGGMEGEMMVVEDGDGASSMGGDGQVGSASPASIELSPRRMQPPRIPNGHLATHRRRSASATRLPHLTPATSSSLSLTPHHTAPVVLPKLSKTRELALRLGLHVAPERASDTWAAIRDRVAWLFPGEPMVPPSHSSLPAERAQEWKQLGETLQLPLFPSLASAFLAAPLLLLGTGCERTDAAVLQIIAEYFASTSSTAPSSTRPSPEVLEEGLRLTDVIVAIVSDRVRPHLATLHIPACSALRKALSNPLPSFPIQPCAPGHHPRTLFRVFRTHLSAALLHARRHAVAHAAVAWMQSPQAGPLSPIVEAALLGRATDAAVAARSARLGFEDFVTEAASRAVAAAFWWDGEAVRSTSKHTLDQPSSSSSSSASSIPMHVRVGKLRREWSDSSDEDGAEDLSMEEHGLTQHSWLPLWHDPWSVLGIDQSITTPNESPSHHSTPSPSPPATSGPRPIRTPPTMPTSSSAPPSSSSSVGVAIARTKLLRGMVAKAPTSWQTVLDCIRTASEEQRRWKSPLEEEYFLALHAAVTGAPFPEENEEDVMDEEEDDEGEGVEEVDGDDDEREEGGEGGRGRGVDSKGLGVIIVEEMEKGSLPGWHPGFRSTIADCFLLGSACAHLWSHVGDSHAEGARGYNSRLSRLFGLRIAAVLASAISVQAAQRHALLNALLGRVLAARLGKLFENVPALLNSFGSAGAPVIEEGVRMPHGVASSPPTSGSGSGGGGSGGGGVGGGGASGGGTGVDRGAGVGGASGGGGGGGDGSGNGSGKGRGDIVAVAAAEALSEVLGSGPEATRLPRPPLPSARARVMVGESNPRDFDSPGGLSPSSASNIKSLELQRATGAMARSFGGSAFAISERSAWRLATRLLGQIVASHSRAIKLEVHTFLSMLVAPVLSDPAGIPWAQEAMATAVGNALWDLPVSLPSAYLNLDIAAPSLLPPARAIRVTSSSLAEAVARPAADPTRDSDWECEQVRGWRRSAAQATAALARRLADAAATAHVASTAPDSRAGHAIDAPTPLPPSRLTPSHKGSAMGKGGAEEKRRISADSVSSSSTTSPLAAPKSPPSQSTPSSTTHALSPSRLGSRFARSARRLLVRTDSDPTAPSHHSSHSTPLPPSPPNASFSTILLYRREDMERCARLCDEVHAKAQSEGGGKKALRRLLTERMVTPSPDAVVDALRFLRRSWGQASIGDLLTERGGTDTEQSMLAAARARWFTALDFADEPFDQALRRALANGGMQLPGEAQKVERVAEAFAIGYFAGNRRVHRAAACRSHIRKRLFQSPKHSSSSKKSRTTDRRILDLDAALSPPPPRTVRPPEASLPMSKRRTIARPDGRMLLTSNEVAFVLCFSCIMLHTDAHNSNIRPDRRMTLDEFVRNNRGIDTTTGAPKSLPRPFLAHLYREITGKEISALPRPPPPQRRPTNLIARVLRSRTPRPNPPSAARSDSSAASSSTPGSSSSSPQSPVYADGGPWNDAKFASHVAAAAGDVSSRLFALHSMDKTDTSIPISTAPVDGVSPLVPQPARHWRMSPWIDRLTPRLLTFLLEDTWPALDKAGRASVAWSGDDADARMAVAGVQAVGHCLVAALLLRNANIARAAQSTLATMASAVEPEGTWKQLPWSRLVHEAVLAIAAEAQRAEAAAAAAAAASTASATSRESSTSTTHRGSLGSRGDDGSGTGRSGGGGGGLSDSRGFLRRLRSVRVPKHSSHSFDHSSDDAASPHLLQDASDSSPASRSSLPRSPTGIPPLTSAWSGAARTPARSSITGASPPPSTSLSHHPSFHHPPPPSPAVTSAIASAVAAVHMAIQTLVRAAEHNAAQAGLRMAAARFESASLVESLVSDKHRRVLMQGALTKLHRAGAGRAAQYECLLFSDVFIYGRPRWSLGGGNARLRAHQVIRVEDIDVEPNPTIPDTRLDLRHAFLLQTSLKPLVFVAPSSTVKNAWVRRLESAVRERTRLLRRAERRSEQPSSKEEAAKASKGRDGGQSTSTSSTTPKPPVRRRTVAVLTKHPRGSDAGSAASPPPTSSTHLPTHPPHPLTSSSPRSSLLRRKVRPRPDSRGRKLVDLKREFRRAVQVVRPVLASHGLVEQIGDAEKARLFGLYQQARLGDAPTDGGEFADERLRHAWVELRGVRKRDAMAEFIAVLDATWSSWRTIIPPTTASHKEPKRAVRPMRDRPAGGHGE